MSLPFSTIFETTWNDWLQYRKERKLSKYTTIGLKRTLANLVTISGNDETVAIAIINQSIIQNWQGLFPLKHNYNAKQNDLRSEVQAELIRRFAQ